MKEIGGYFELELPFREEYHKNGIRLNSGRNALEYILRAKGYKKLYLPFYTCDVLLEPLKKLNLSYEFYTIDKTFKPFFNFSRLKADEAFVYTNYFGICSTQVSEISLIAKNLIIDNSQAFFSNPLMDIDTFYSPRKFFGVPDGSYLYTTKLLSEEFEQDKSFERCENLIGRIDVDAESFYKIFLRNDFFLSNQPIRIMSKFTERLLKSINYQQVKEKRRENFYLFQRNFDHINILNFKLHGDDIPMVYPLLIQQGKNLKKNLISEKIFVATYWPNIPNELSENSWERFLVENLVCLPIDQRYSIEEISYIVNYIQKELRLF